jgi:hypothetical protein
LIRLAGKSRREHIVIRDFSGPELGDVADWRLAEPLAIGSLAVTVPLASEHGSPTSRFEREAKPADTREEIDEGERNRIRIGFDNSGRVAE